jgi:hypothetical protein
VLRLRLHVKGVAGGHLHPVGQLERLEARLQGGVLGPRLLVPAVQIREQVELPPLVATAGRGGWLPPPSAVA